MKQPFKILMHSYEFTKYHGPTILTDWERLKALELICRQVPDVVTPKARSMELENQTITYDRWALQNPLTKMIESTETYYRLGRILSNMQKANFCITSDRFLITPYPLGQLRLSLDDIHALEENVPQSWLHSDFWHGNCFTGSEDSFIIIDPLPNASYLLKDYIFASGALDAAFMYMSIIICQPMIGHIVSRRRYLINSAEHFLAGFAAGHEINNEFVISSIRRMSRTLALNFIKDYHTRLPAPTAQMKALAAYRYMAKIDKEIDWCPK